MSRVDPPLAGTEEETLLAYLEFQRETLRTKAAGLDGEQLARTTASTTMTLGGLLKHLALVESSWFSEDLLGLPMMAPFDTVDWEADRDWEWHTAAADSPEELFALFDAAVAESNRIIGDALAGEGLDQLSVATSRRRTGERFSLRWIVLHMIEEYARHNGHADLLRESIDGEVGQ